MTVREQLTIDNLILLLEEEHTDHCNNNTCDIFFAHEQGYTYWAIELFRGTGAASEKFDRLYNALDHKKFITLAHDQRDFMAGLPHIVCPECNSIIWFTHNTQCDECCNDLDDVEISYGG